MVAIVGLILAAVVLADRQGWLLYGGDELARYDSQTFLVTRVIDGDTLDIAAPDGTHPTTRIRLWGVNTPELARTNPPTPAEPFAEEAKRLTWELTHGQRVRLTLEPHRLRDNYGRILAFVELPDGSLLSEALLVQGLAKVFDRYSHRYIERFDLLQLQARRQGLGIWAVNNR